MLRGSARPAAPPLIELWRGLVSDAPAKLAPSLRESEVAWAIQTGMAALLVDAVDLDDWPEDLAARLLAAERWARLRHADSLATALELLDSCADRAPPLTLLKGISIGPERYPQAYQRFLGDLDLLAPRESLDAVLGVLDALGYAPDGESPEDFSDHHHLAPLRHPRTGVWVELHTELFPASAGFAETGPFSPREVLAERRRSTLEGRAVFRLSPELQVVYIASHWAHDFSAATGARALLDMLLLLRQEADTLDWQRILGWLEDRRIAAHLQLMLRCLEAWELLEVPQELRKHWERVAVLEPAAVEVLVGMAERYQVRGAMAGVRELRRGPPDGPIGTLRSRLATLRSALATRNLRGLLPILDTLPWTALLDPTPSLLKRLLVRWCRLFPPGDPDRFVWR
jgi:hypothetical protein